MNYSLFDPTLPVSGEIWVPPVTEAALERGAALCLSISGGKDSQAMLIAVTRWFRAKGYTGALVATHADLGRAEWPQTKAFVVELCDSLGIPLLLAQRTKGDLVARIEERLEKVAGTGTPFWPSSASRYCTSHLKSGPLDTEMRKPLPVVVESSAVESEKIAPFWPSSANRYCTSDLKRGPLDTEMRVYDMVISAEGVRADESPARAKKSVLEVRPSITASSKDESRNLAAMTPEDALAAKADGQRLAFNWRPIFHWTEADVWRECGTSEADLERRRMLYKTGNHEVALDGWPLHPAYVYGNSRLSCALCVLADKNDLTNGANHNPQLYGHYLELERRGGATFKNDFSLAELRVSGEAARVRDAFLERSNPIAQAARIVMGDDAVRAEEAKVTDEFLLAKCGE